MKIIFASDIHGSTYYANILIRQFLNEKADKLVLLGDILYHGPRNPIPRDYHPLKTAEILNQYSDKIICVRGNCDNEADQKVLNFPIMADYAQLVADNYTFFLTHGHLYKSTDLKAGLDTIFVFGHIHVTVLEKNQVYVLNPGSISLPKDNKPSTYAIYENGTIQIKTIDGQILDEMELM